MKVYVVIRTPYLADRRYSLVGVYDSEQDAILNCTRVNECYTSWELNKPTNGRDANDEDHLLIFPIKTNWNASFPTEEESTKVNPGEPYFWYKNSWG